MLGAASQFDSPTLAQDDTVEKERPRKRIYERAVEAPAPTEFALCTVGISVLVGDGAHDVPFKGMKSTLTRVGMVIVPCNN